LVFEGFGSQCAEFILKQRESLCGNLDIISRLYGIADREDRSVLRYKVKKGNKVE
jgi:hypothetical protein